LLRFSFSKRTGVVSVIECPYSIEI